MSPALTALLALGTARADLPPEFEEWLEKHEVTDPTAEAAERLLAAISLRERMGRLRDRTIDLPGDLPAPAPPPTSAPAPAPLQRAFSLLLSEDGPYRALLPQAVDYLRTHGSHFPPATLPAVLTAALRLTDLNELDRWLTATGARGTWLAAQHPDWRRLTPDFDFATAFAREGMPAARAELLRRWRHYAPAAAREGLNAIWDRQPSRTQELLLASLGEGLSADDLEWLRERPSAKRKKVLRVAYALRLRIDETLIEDAANLVRAAYDAQLRKVRVVADPEGWQAITKRSGGPAKRETSADFALAVLPPGTWLTHGAEELPAFLGSLPPTRLASFCKGVAELKDERTAEFLLEFFASRVLSNVPKLSKELRPELYGSHIAELVPNELFAERTAALLGARDELLTDFPALRWFFLSRTTPWPAQLSRAVMNFYLRQTAHTSGYAPGVIPLLNEWKQALPLLSTDIFPWLRTQLHAATERPDAIGKLATETLQILAFRRQIFAPPPAGS